MIPTNTLAAAAGALVVKFILRIMLFCMLDGIKPVDTKRPMNTCDTPAPSTVNVQSPPVAPGAVPPIKLLLMSCPPLVVAAAALLTFMALVTAPETVLVLAVVWYKLLPVMVKFVLPVVTKSPNWDVLLSRNQS